jgi:DNA-binding Lrp family transcriptional regulator
MADEKSKRFQAYVLLNVESSHQKDIVSKSKVIPTVQNVKTVYGIYDIMIILESNDMGAVKQAIDVNIHNLEGITNMTSLVTVGLAGAILE